jgi:putative hydrolase of the HAD superfamily
MANAEIRAVLWDFGGVMTESPFLAFRRFEREHGLPVDFLRRINSQNHDSNAWARFERAELSPQQFDEAFAAETRLAGHEVRGLDVIDLLHGEIRPAMVTALKACKMHFTNACVTNNVNAGPGRGLDRERSRATEWRRIFDLFDVIIESSKIGQRKPEVRFFQRACEQLGIVASQAVYLDDLGSNLKPARTMGMHTIKVDNPDVAIAELEAVLGISLKENSS